MMDARVVRTIGLKTILCYHVWNMSTPIKSQLEIGQLGKLTTYQAGAMQMAANRSLRLLCDKILTPYGITKTQWLVIGAALDAGPGGIQIGELGRLVDLSARGLLNIVTILVKKEMLILRPNSKNAAKRVVAIHPKFAPDCQEIERIMRVALREVIYDNVTPLEFRIYLKVMYHLSQIHTPAN